MPEIVAQLFERARLLLDLDRPAEALEQVHRILAANPDDPDALTLLARTLLRLDRTDEALAAAQSACRADPESPDALSLAAACETRRQEFRAARRHLDAAIALAPAHAGLHVQSAQLARLDGRPTQAVSAARRACHLAPESGAALVALAEAQLAAGDRAGAVRTADAALRLDPADPDAHQLKGEILLRSGGGAESVVRFRDALRLDPSDASARLGLELALKTRNPLFRVFFRFELWLETLSTGARWAIRFAPFVISRILAPGRDRPGVQVLLVLLFVVVALSWLTEPIANAALLASRRDRAVLRRDARRSTWLFLLFLAVTIALAVLGLATGDHRYVLVTLGAVFWAAALGSSHEVGPREARLLVGLGLAQLPATAAFVVVAAVGADGVAGALAALVLVSGIAAFVVTAVQSARDQPSRTTG